MPDGARGLTLYWESGSLLPEDVMDVERTLHAHRWNVVARFVFEGVAYIEAEPPTGRGRKRPPSVGHEGIVQMRPRAVA